MSELREPKEPPRINNYQEADQVLLNYLAPAGVVVNEQLEILQFRGQTERYLVPAPGKASLDILKMAREGLLGALKTAIDQVKKTGVPAERKGIRLRHNRTEPVPQSRRRKSPDFNAHYRS